MHNISCALYWCVFSCTLGDKRILTCRVTNKRANSQYTVLLVSWYSFNFHQPIRSMGYHFHDLSFLRWPRRPIHKFMLMWTVFLTSMLSRCDSQYGRTHIALPNTERMNDHAQVQRQKLSLRCIRGLRPATSSNLVRWEHDVAHRFVDWRVHHIDGVFLY